MRRELGIALMVGALLSATCNAALYHAEMAGDWLSSQDANLTVLAINFNHDGEGSDSGIMGLGIDPFGPRPLFLVAQPLRCPLCGKSFTYDKRFRRFYGLLAESCVNCGLRRGAIQGWFDGAAKQQK